ncbi:MAG TPA: helix-turn-helix domain-containing protein, partial [Spongiibacteraceae bacterium]|nr:helix-turn-helix domain-containing protein [Spongiibacteraceae bacterium]
MSEWRVNALADDGTLPAEVILVVKRSHSGSRLLGVLEAIASQQPIGVTALARLLDEDKSAIQRALMTLADAGWIHTVSEPPTRWELSAHILAVAYAAHGRNDLRRRARPIMERLRDDTQETVLLALPDVKNFVIADVVESRQMLRMVPDIGDIIAPRNTATGRAMLAFMNREQQIALLDTEPEPPLLDGFELTRARGYAISEGETNPLATNIAAPIIEADG